jgi:hypothetical protein
MRMTIEIPDALYRRLKPRAAREQIPVNVLILRGVEHALKGEAPAPGRRVSLPLVRSKRPGSRRIDNARIYDVISFP